MRINASMKAKSIFDPDSAKSRDGPVSSVENESSRTLSAISFLFIHSTFSNASVVMVELRWTAFFDYIYEVFHLNHFSGFIPYVK